MMLISSAWNEEASFRLMPTTLDCPFVEAIYDPSNKVLAVLSKDKKQIFQMIAKLDEQGDTLPVKKPRKNLKPFQEKREVIESLHEHYIDKKEEIEYFINRFAENAEVFDYKSILNSVPKIQMPQQQQPAIIMP